MESGRKWIRKIGEDGARRRKKEDQPIRGSK